MRKTHIGAAIVGAIIIAASCGENQSPVAPTPVPEPTLPVALRTLEIMGIPEAGLPAGEVVQLTAQIRLPDAGTEAVFRPTWTSSNPDIATVDIQGVLVGLMVGRTEITATHQQLDAKADLEVTPAQPNETLWREIAFAYHVCPPTDCGAPLETRQLWRLPVTSPNFAIVSETLSNRAIANLHEVLGLGAEQITGKPYQGTIQESDSVAADNWITIEGAIEEEYGTSGTCAMTRIPKGRTAVASLGHIRGCMLLGMHREEGSSTQTILHELGHTMGFYHTSDYRTLMFNAQSARRSTTFTAQEQYHTQLAYRYPRGTTYGAIKLSTFGPQHHLRPRQVDPRPIFIVD